MPGTDPFVPDADYCVYCHAEAAGSCALCAALCCPDCVELVGGLVTPRAVCRSCLARGDRPAGLDTLLQALWPWVAGLVLLAAGLIWWRA